MLLLFQPCPSTAISEKTLLIVLMIKFFLQGEACQPSLVIVYFGGNDSVKPHPNGLSSHVPLDEYVENMKKIAIHLKVYSVLV